MPVVIKYINLALSQCDSGMKLRWDNLLNRNVPKIVSLGLKSGEQTRPGTTRICPCTCMWPIINLF